MLEFFRAVFDSVLGSGIWRGHLQETWSIILLCTALIRGGGPEKIAIGIWMAMLASIFYLRSYFAGSETVTQEWSDVAWAAFVGDSWLLIGFVALALVANRQYVFWLAGLQVIAVMAHLVRASSDELTPFVYAVMVAAPGWLQVFVMTAGQIAHARRKRGRYPDWRWQVARPAPVRTVS